MMGKNTHRCPVIRSNPLPQTVIRLVRVALLTIDPTLLQQIATALKIPAEAIQNFDDEQAVNVIANTYSFQDFKDNAVASGFTYQPTSIQLIK